MDRHPFSRKEENRISALRNAIQEGINSGIDEDFDAKKHLAALKKGNKTKYS